MEVNVVYSGIEFTVTLDGNDDTDNLSWEIVDCNGDDIEDLLNELTIDAIVNLAVKKAEENQKDDFDESDTEDYED